MPQFELVEFPQSFRHLVNFAMAGFSRLFALPELAGKRVTVTYVAATPADQALIDAFGGILNVFPAFIVNLKPQLKVEGQLLAEGQGVSLGSNQILRSAFRRPLETGFDVNDKVVTTGSAYSISLDLQRVPTDAVRQQANRLDRFLASVDPSSPLPPEGIEEALHLTGLTYFMQVDALNDLGAKVAKVIYTREPSEAFVSQDIVTFFLFGFPFIVAQGGLTIDVKRDNVNPTSRVGDPRQEVAWMVSSGSVGSAAEHAVFEQLYKLPAVSTERLLTLASSRGIPVFTIDRSNLAQVLPQLDTFPVVKQNITAFVNAGFVAVVPQRNQRFFNWQGTGWIVLDPTTGAAGYLIAGSLVLGGSLSAGGSSGVAFAFDGQAARGAAIAAREEAEALAMFKDGAELTQLAVVASVAAVLTQSITLAVIAGGLVFVGVGMAVAAAETIGLFNNLNFPR